MPIDRAATLRNAEKLIRQGKLDADIQEFVRTHLSAHEYPREIAFIDEMPMTTTGKVIRRLLRAKG